MKALKIIVAGILASLLWAALAFYGGLSGWWLDAIAERGNTRAFMDAATSMVDNSSAGSAAFTLVEKGEIYDSHYRGSDRTVDGDTLFAAASLSKWPTAYGVMLLVQEGKIDLDAPVSTYLTRWQLPPSEFDHSQVTVGRLLSHTAGLGDELGFGDYTAEEALPSLEESLENPRDSEGADARIAVTAEPGSGWNYSGGGYLILELLVEEVTGRPFADYMQEAVFVPIGMNRSNYDFLGGQDNNAGSFERGGDAAPLYQYASRAATALNTTTNDMTRFVLSQLGDAAPLGLEQIAAMREPLGREMGMAIWGRGVMLHSPNGQGDYIFGHDGANDPSINASVRIDPTTGDAIIALSTGPAYLASRIAYQWGLWQNGHPDFIQSNLAIDSAIKPALLGVVLILALTVGVLVRAFRSSRRIMQ
jgi:CubicO group peptidase (beta-lactamase class C family)